MRSLTRLGELVLGSLQKLRIGGTHTHVQLLRLTPHHQLDGHHLGPLLLLLLLLLLLPLPLLLLLLLLLLGGSLCGNKGGALRSGGRGGDGAAGRRGERGGAAPGDRVAQAALGVAGLVGGGLAPVDGLDVREGLLVEPLLLQGARAPLQGLGVGGGQAEGVGALPGGVLEPVLLWGAGACGFWVSMETESGATRLRAATTAASLLPLRGAYHGNPHCAP